MIILVSPGFLTPNDEAARLISAVIDNAAEQDVTISAMDGRGLYTTTWDPTERSSRSAMAAEAQDQYRKASLSSSENVLASLADGTGGTYVHNSNDLSGGFDTLLAGPEFLYLLAFDPGSLKSPRGSHHLKVKVNQKGLRLQFRQAYYPRQ